MDNNIYQVSARIKNLAAAKDHAFSDQGRALCNMYTHVIMALYAFSDTLEDRAVAEKLNNLIFKQESFPANLLDLFKPVEEPESDYDETQSDSEED